MVGGGQGCHTAIGRCSDDLPGIFLPEVANGIDTGDCRFTLLIGDDIPFHRHLDACRYDGVIGIKSDKNKHTVY